MIRVRFACRTCTRVVEVGAAACRLRVQRRRFVEVGAERFLIDVDCPCGAVQPVWFSRRSWLRILDARIVAAEQLEAARELLHATDDVAGAVEAVGR